MPDPITIGLMAGPPLIKGLNAAFGLGKSKPSKYEKKMMNMADIFGEESTLPITETRAFQSGKSQLDARDEDNRRAINNASAVSGATDEAKLANMQNSNESYNRGMQNLLGYAERVRNRNRGQYMNLLGSLEGLKSNRQNRRSQQLSSILDPLSQAGQAMYMADMLESGSGSTKSDKSTLSDVGSLAWS